MPFNRSDELINGEPMVNAYTKANARAVTKLETKFQKSCPYMSENFSFPVGWIFASFIHSFPATGPCIRKPIINAASAARKTGRK